jgi:acetyltransferase-like isoleucine patch superfamily enzyme
MAFLTLNQLSILGLKHCGKNVRISDKASIHNADQIEIGDNSRIDDFCVVSGKVKIGNNVLFAVLCNVAAGTAGIEFDDFATLAYGVHVFAQSDDYTGATMTNPTVPAQFKQEVKATVKIGRHCIVGAGSIIFPGVHLMEGTAIGALTLVTKSTEPWSIYVGQPARKVRDRKRDLLDLETDFLESSKT